MDPEWYSRGYVPHRERGGLLQTIAYRLADSLPTRLLAQLEEELATVPPQRMETWRRRKMETWLDAGHGSCTLRNPQAARCIVETWRRFDGERYDLIAYTVMPNHVHVLIRVYDGVALAKIVQSWKSFTARRIRQLLRPEANAPRIASGRPAKEEKRGGPDQSRPISPVWGREYWDRYIRNKTHFAAAVDYIHNNPVKAGLVETPEEWPWSSAREWCDAGPEPGTAEPQLGS